MGVDFDTLGSYYPINRSDKYPRALLANFTRLKVWKRLFSPAIVFVRFMWPAV